MSLDPRSRERLEALGRRLPQPLPVPKSKPGPSAAPRHRLESEENPEQLFRELMAASPDGSVPTHLLERLRTLEAERDTPSAPPVPATVSRSSPAGPDRATASGRPSSRGANTGDDHLYATFAQLLLEQDDGES